MQDPLTDMYPNKDFLITAGIFIVLSLLLPSCHETKMTALQCPRVSTSNHNKAAKINKRDKNKTFIANLIVNQREKSVSNLARVVRKNRLKNNVVFNSSPISKNPIAPDSENIINPDKTAYLKGLTASIDNNIIPLRLNNSDLILIKKDRIKKQPSDINKMQPNFCDTIILKSGSIVIGKVVKSGSSTISYRICDESKGPAISILKSDISEIRNSNGEKIFVTSSYLYSSRGNNKERKTEVFGFVGFLLSLIGLNSSGVYVINLLYYIGVFGISFYYIMIPMGYLGIILGIISLIRIRRNQNKYKGRVLAKLSLIIGISIEAIITLEQIIIFIFFLMTI